MKFFIIAFVTLLYISHGIEYKVTANDGKCRVLALEGGGDLGAFHAGAYSQMVEMLSAAEINY